MNLTYFCVTVVAISLLFGAISPSIMIQEVDALKSKGVSTKQYGAKTDVCGNNLCTDVSKEQTDPNEIEKKYSKVDSATGEFILEEFLEYCYTNQGTLVDPMEKQDKVPPLCKLHNDTFCSPWSFVEGKCLDLKFEDPSDSDLDEFGCVPSAGYSWSDEKQECVRELEEKSQEESQNMPIPFLFIETSQSGIFLEQNDNLVLTLNDKTPVTVVFSDRPNIISEHKSIQGFEHKLKDDSSFENVPTNILTDNLGFILIMELMNPTYDSEAITLQYEVIALDELDLTDSDIDIENSSKSFDTVSPYMDNPVEDCIPEPNTYLTGCDFSNADLIDADFSDSYLREVNFLNANLIFANFSGADLTLAELVGADLRGTLLKDADLTLAELVGADLRGAELKGSDLRSANLSGANLSGADLSSTNLIQADLSGADLRGADLRGAKLYETLFCEANLSAAKFTGKLNADC